MEMFHITLTHLRLSYWLVELLAGVLMHASAVGL